MIGQRSGLTPGRSGLLLTVAAAALLAACASPAGPAHSPAPASSATAPSTASGSASTGGRALDGCLPATARVLDASAPDETLPVGVLGAGARTVVLSEQSDELLCSWLPLARHLTGRGFRVAVWDFSGADPVAELTSVVTALNSAGDDQVILAGASEGAKASLIAASRLPRSPLGVLSLSAEPELQGTPVAPAVHRLPCPALLITARDDPYGAAGAARTFAGTAPPGRVQLLTVPGSDHGTALLAGPGSAAVLARIDAFLGQLG
jgi:pimeloyl-ACP methyl ester carboxylesterase